MRTTAAAALASVTSLALLGMALGACSGGPGSGTPGHLAKHLYLTLNERKFDRAQEMLAGESAIARLIARYGSLAGWADRVTKNGIISQVHTIEGSTDNDDTAVAIELVVMFHDGTRRRDRVRAVRHGSAWRIDAASLIGNEDNDGNDP